MELIRQCAATWERLGQLEDVRLGTSVLTTGATVMHNHDVKYVVLHRWYFANPAGELLLSQSWMSEQDANRLGGIRPDLSDRTIQRVPEDDYERAFLKRIGELRE